MYIDCIYVSIALIQCSLGPVKEGRSQGTKVLHVKFSKPSSRQ